MSQSNEMPSPEQLLKNVENYINSKLKSSNLNGVIEAKIVKDNNKTYIKFETTNLEPYKLSAISFGLDSSKLEDQEYLHKLLDRFGDVVSGMNFVYERWVIQSGS